MLSKNDATRTWSSLADAELDFPAFSPKRQPITTPGERFWSGHWVGFLFLLPFVVMLVIHELYGLSWAFLGAGLPGVDAPGFNLLMFGADFLGIVAFVLYAFALPIVKGTGWRWVMPKLIFVVLYWGAGMLAVFALELLHS